MHATVKGVLKLLCCKGCRVRCHCHLMDFGCDNVAEVTGALVHHSLVITFLYMLGVVVTLQVDNCVLDACGC